LARRGRQQRFRHAASRIPLTVPRRLTVGFILPRAETSSSESVQPAVVSLTRHPVPKDRPARGEHLEGSPGSLFATSTRSVHSMQGAPSSSLRSVLGVPPALDGLLHHRPCGFVSPHSHVQGFPFRVFPFRRSRTGLLRPRALMPFLHRDPTVTCARPRCLDSKALLPAEVR